MFVNSRVASLVLLVKGINQLEIRRPEDETRTYNQEIGNGARNASWLLQALQRREPKQELEQIDV